MNGLKTNILTDRELENDFLELDEFLENTAPAGEDDSYSFDISDDIKIMTPANQSQSTAMKTKKKVIFQGSKLTVSAATVLILSFRITFLLSSTALSNLLLLIISCYPNPPIYVKHCTTFENIFSPSKLQCFIITPATTAFLKW